MIFKIRIYLKVMILQAFTEGSFYQFEFEIHSLTFSIFSHSTLLLGLTISSAFALNTK